MDSSEDQILNTQRTHALRLSEVSWGHPGYSNYPLIRKQYKKQQVLVLPKKSHFLTKRLRPQFHPVSYVEVKCYLGAKRKKNMKKHVINKNLAGFVTFHCALCLTLVYSNIVKTYETLLTYDLHIRNTDPHFH